MFCAVTQYVDGMQKRFMSNGDSYICLGRHEGRHDRQRYITARIPYRGPDADALSPRMMPPLEDARDTEDLLNGDRPARQSSRFY
jgi:hypothetical protein